jgi:hypothetical protein
MVSCVSRSCALRSRVSWPEIQLAIDATNRNVVRRSKCARRKEQGVRICGLGAASL